ncbi:hypothetical protein PIB30_059148 [Stylosanthes scabra]|uniref:Uncharacterized protein n=1 Tax=Stylosanthes scabra TaxID=79078 RepID=A0ABU6XIS5_9FABA|nr:hypothetical protein [Stylosanthes scabra]
MCLSRKEPFSSIFKRIRKLGLDARKRARNIYYRVQYPEVRTTELYVEIEDVEASSGGSNPPPPLVHVWPTHAPDDEDVCDFGDNRSFGELAVAMAGTPQPPSPQICHAGSGVGPVDGDSGTGVHGLHGFKLTVEFQIGQITAFAVGLSIGLWSQIMRTTEISSDHRQLDYHVIYDFIFLMVQADVVVTIKVLRHMMRPPRPVQNPLISKQEFVLDSFEPTMGVSCKFRKAAPSSYKSKLGLQRGLDLVWKLEIPILALILILSDGQKKYSLDFAPERSHGGTVRSRGYLENARGDRATARCLVSHFLASSCEPFASNAFLSLPYAFLNP